MATKENATHEAVPPRRLASALFGATIFLGAFLLFQSQPLVSKAILPWFGGCPAVWTTCMLFFETLLVGGYLYAHLVQSHFLPRAQAVVHFVVCAVAVAALPILPGEAWKPSPGGNPAWEILWLLTCTVGMPYFALSATSPLVQTWFSRVFPGRSPYRLYSLSNVGSLAALLSYPVVFEPAFALPMQSKLWSACFAVYTVLIAVCWWPLRRCASASDVENVGEVTKAASAKDKKITWFDRFCWVALPACACFMLLAATNHICQDVAVVPFLWVAPLSLYLLSFIICFDHARWYVRWLWAGLAIPVLAGVAANDIVKISTTYLTLLPELTLYLSALFIVCMVCHGELVRQRPAAKHLTEYYLLISIGGAIGGLLVAVVAPVVFATYFEWPIGVGVSFVLAVGLLVFPRVDAGRGGFIRMLRLGAFCIAIGGVLCYWVFWETGSGVAVANVRNFFGVVTIDKIAYPNDGGELRLKNGRITHGRQHTDPAKAAEPTSYYGRQTGVGLAIAAMQKDRSGKPIRIGAIGLGVGTLAAYVRPGDSIRFYEINPDVVELANRYFTYLPKCRGKHDVVLGDARLSLETELPKEPQEFDVLVVDAFSGDSIPTHLLTREALAVYRRHLASDGIVAFHISNNYLRLAPVVRRLAEDCGMHAICLMNSADDANLVHTSRWVLVARSESFLALHFPTADPWEPRDADGPLWTDKYSNLFQILEW